MVDQDGVKQFLDIGLYDALGCGDVNAYVRQCAGAAGPARRRPRHLATVFTNRGLSQAERRDLQAVCERVLVG